MSANTWLQRHKSGSLQLHLNAWAIFPALRDTMRHVADDNPVRDGTSRRALNRLPSGALAKEGPALRSLGEGRALQGEKEKTSRLFLIFPSVPDFPDFLS